MQISSIRKSTDEISVYDGELTPKCLIESVAVIKKSFPALPIGFYDVFTDRLKANGFSDERLKDAIAHVIDTCVYPQPTIAQFISYDKKIKLNSYEDMLKKLNEFGPDVWNSYKMIKMADRIKPVWVHVDDVKKIRL